MLFEDLDTLNEMIDLIRSGADTRQLSQQNKESKAGKPSRRFRDLMVSYIDAKTLGIKSKILLPIKHHRILR